MSSDFPQNLNSVSPESVITFKYNKNWINYNSTFFYYYNYFEETVFPLQMIFLKTLCFKGGNYDTYTW